MNNMIKISKVLIVLLFIIGCKPKSEESYSVNDICECYSQSNFIGFDATLGKCMTDWDTYINVKRNNVATNKKRDIVKNEFMLLIKKLVQSCSKYHDDLNTMLLNKPEGKDEQNLSYRMHAIKRKIKKRINVSKNLLLLSELEIVSEDYDKALLTINKSIKLNPKNEDAYLIRGLLVYKKGNVPDAITDFKKILEMSKDADTRLKAELWILNLEERVN